MKKLLLLFAILLPIIGFSQGNLDMKFRNLTSDSLWLRKKPGWATTDTSAYKVIYRRASDGKMFEKGLKLISDSVWNSITLGRNGFASGQLNFIASDNDQGNININTSDQFSVNNFKGGIVLGDSVYPAHLNINSLVSTTGTGALKSVSDSGYVKTLGDIIYGNLSFSGADRNIYNLTNHALVFGTNNTERMRIDNLGTLKDPSFIGGTSVPFIGSYRTTYYQVFEGDKSAGANTYTGSGLFSNKLNGYFAPLTTTSGGIIFAGFRQATAGTAMQIEGYNGSAASESPSVAIKCGYMNAVNTLSAHSATGQSFGIYNLTTNLLIVYGNGDTYWNGSSAKIIGLSANAAGSAGSNITVKAGSTTADATPRSVNGGMYSAYPGQSVGAGFASCRIGRNARQTSATATNLNAISDAVIIPSEFNLSDNVQASLFEVALANNEGAGGGIEFTITATDGDTTQVYTGYVIYSIANGNGVCTEVITESVANTIDVPAAVTNMTTAWAITSTCGTKATIKVTADTGFTPTAMKIRYKIHNGGNTAITQL